MNTKKRGAPLIKTDIIISVTPEKITILRNGIVFQEFTPSHYTFDALRLLTLGTITTMIHRAIIEASYD